MPHYTIYEFIKPFLGKKKMSIFEEYRPLMRGIFNDGYAIVFWVFFFFGFFIKSFGVGSHLNCLDLIQMSPHNILL